MSWSRIEPDVDQLDSNIEYWHNLKKTIWTWIAERSNLLWRYSGNGLKGTMRILGLLSTSSSCLFSEFKAFRLLLERLCRSKNSKLTFIAYQDNFESHFSQRKRMIVHSRTTAQIAKHNDESAFFIFIFEFGPRANKDKQEPETNSRQLNLEISYFEEKRRRKHIWKTMSMLLFDRWGWKSQTYETGRSWSRQRNEDPLNFVSECSIKSISAASGLFVMLSYQAPLRALIF